MGDPRSGLKIRSILTVKSLKAPSMGGLRFHLLLFIVPVPTGLNHPASGGTLGGKMAHRAVSTMIYEGNSRGRGTPQTTAHFEDAGRTMIVPGASVWASVTEIDYSANNQPKNGSAYLSVQQVVPAYSAGVVDVGIWIDNVPDNVNWRCYLFISHEVNF